jgi:hypothetical protein
VIFRFPGPLLAELLKQYLDSVYGVLEFALDERLNPGLGLSNIWRNTNWFGWRNQIPALAEAGCRVIVPDQRGYNLSDKPKGIKSYRIDELVKDVLGLIDALDYEKVNLVGHEWGRGPCLARQWENSYLHRSGY